MNLSKETIHKIEPREGLALPTPAMFELPEKVLQFGTGVLLRGLPDYFIDKANRQGVFNGRIVVVKSTASGGTDAFAKQDGLYTLCVKGIENSVKTEETIINSSISRVLSAINEWDQVLACASNPALQLVISNTTELGIVPSDDDIKSQPPPSFPGKLLAFLYARYQAFEGKEGTGLVIVPTELIIDNASKLRAIVIELAQKNGLEPAFLQWLESDNHFCNSLVDRIVPGRLPKAEQERTEEILGYKDELMIMAESFRLWAIESGSERVREVLSFSIVDEGVIITPDIEKFRELKLRLLNGTHTFSSGLAVLAGFQTVRDAMNDEHMAAFIRRLMLLEIASALNGGHISYNEACAFANSVTDRFRNPFIEHLWMSITMNFTSKMRLRNIPLLLRHYNSTDKVPEQMALGFAAYLLFMKCTEDGNGGYAGNVNGRSYNIQDDKADYFSEKWANNTSHQVVEQVLADEGLWGTDLSQLNGFEAGVKKYISLIEKEGAPAVLAGRHLSKTMA